MEDVRCLEFGDQYFKLEDFLMEGFLEKSGLALGIFGFFGFGGSQVALSSLSVVLFQFSQWIISQILQFFQSCLRILNSQVCYLLVFFSSHKKHFSNSSVRFGFRLSSVFGFHGGLLWTLQTNIVPSFVCSTFEDLQAG